MKLEQIDMAGVKIELPNLEQIRNKKKQSLKRSQLTVAIQIMKDTEPFVPMQSGSQKNRAQVGESLVKGSRQETKQAVESGDPVVIYPGPYAHYLYVGKLMVDPVTGSAWASYGTTKVYNGDKLDIKKNAHPQATDHWFEASKAINKDKWVRVARRAIQREF